MQLEAISATILPRGASYQTTLRGMKGDAGNTGKRPLPSAIRNNTQLVRTAARSTFFQKVSRTRGSVSVLYTLCADSHEQLVEQQSIELIDSAKRQRLRWCSKLSSSKQQHSVQVRIVQKLRWHETSAETPNNLQLREDTRKASESDGLVFQLQDSETHLREAVTSIITILPGVSSKTISQT